MKRPNNPGQLFYKDMLKLKPGAELTIYYSFNDKPRSFNVQVIKVGRDMRYSYTPWYVKCRHESGNESSYMFRALGMVPKLSGGKDWYDVYTTLRYPNEEKTN